MRKLLAIMLCLAGMEMSSLALIIEHTNTTSIVLSNACMGGFDDFRWQVSGYDNQKFKINTDVSMTNTYCTFRITRPIEGLIYLDVAQGDITVGSTSITWAISRTNIPPPGNYYGELLAQGSTDTNTYRSIAQGKIAVTWSLYLNETNYFQRSTTNAAVGQVYVHPNWVYPYWISNGVLSGITATDTSNWTTAWGWGNWATNGLATAANLTGVSNAVDVLETNTAPLQAHLGLSNRVDIIATNYFPLQSGIGVSNSVDILETNTAPLQAFLGVSNALGIVLTNYTGLQGYLYTSNAFEIVKTNYLDKPSFTGLSNRVNIIETNYFPLQSGLGVSNALGIVLTNYAPLQSYLYTSNNVTVLLTNTAPLQSFLVISNSFIGVSNRVDAMATNYTALTGFTGLSNRVDIIETNYFPLQSGLSVSNDTAASKTNALLLSGSRSMQGNLDMGGNSITNVADASIKFADGTTITAAKITGYDTLQTGKVAQSSYDSYTNWVAGQGWGSPSNWSGYAATQQISWIQTISIVTNLLVTGTLNPDVTGTYQETTAINSHRRWYNSTNLYYIWADAFRYRVNTNAAGVDNDDSTCWHSIGGDPDNPQDSYGPIYNATGDMTVVYSILTNTATWKAGLTATGNWQVEKDSVVLMDATNVYQKDWGDVVSNLASSAVQDGDTLTTGLYDNGTGVEGNQLARVDWVRGLLAIGNPIYMSSNSTVVGYAPLVAQTGESVVDTNAFVSPSATITGINQYVHSMISTGTFYGTLMGPAEVELYCYRQGTGPGQSLSIAMELDYTYDKTNLLGTWTTLGQTVAATSTKLLYTVAFPNTDVTNAYVNYRIKTTARGGNVTNLVIQGGVLTPSHAMLRQPSCETLGIRGATGFPYNADGVITSTAYDTIARRATIGTLASNIFVYTNTADYTDAVYKADNAIHGGTIAAGASDAVTTNAGVLAFTWNTNAAAAGSGAYVAKAGDTMTGTLTTPGIVTTNLQVTGGATNGGSWVCTNANGSGKWSPLVAFGAFLTNSPVCSNNVELVITTWKNEKFDYGNNFNGTTFVAPVNGLYQFSFQAWIYNSIKISDFSYFNIKTNGGNAKQGTAVRGDDLCNAYGIALVSLVLTNGEEVTTSVSTAFAGYTNIIAGSLYSYFEGHLIRELP